MRKHLCWLMLLCMLCTLPVCHAVEAPVLPDPGPSVQAVGELIRENAELNGVPCTVYGYSFSRGDLSFSFVLMAYEWKVEGLDFVWQKMSTQYTDDNLSVSDWYTISKSGHTAHIHLTGNLLGKTCTLTLYVPQGMQFTPEGQQSAPTTFYSWGTGSSTGGATSFYNDSFVGGSAGSTSSFYNSWGTGSSAGGATSFYNEVIEGLDEPLAGAYSDEPTTCSYCYGSGTCPECYGSGRFRNPYTGSYLECSCDHGDCSLCDGEGVW